jgi:hypothetical protein
LRNICQEETSQSLLIMPISKPRQFADSGSYPGGVPESKHLSFSEESIGAVPKILDYVGTCVDESLDLSAARSALSANYSFQLAVIQPFPVILGPQSICQKCYTVIHTTIQRSCNSSYPRRSRMNE